MPGASLGPRAGVLSALLPLVLVVAACRTASPRPRSSFAVYPEVNASRPRIPSPYTDTGGMEYVVAVTKERMYAVIPVKLGDDRMFGPQQVVDAVDFPELAETGLHAPDRLARMSSITGRSLDEITRLGRPNGLSQDGFMAEDETIRSVLEGDHRIVSRLQLTHPQLARPLFHVLNMMELDLSLNRWNMARHQWEQISSFFYHGNTVYVEAHDTKGGQESIFDDGIEGAFHIKLWRDLSPDESRFLSLRYAHLTPEAFDQLRLLLTSLNTGEMQPQYIMRYGFYEGHTFWRTDPIAIAFIFGLRTLEELDTIFQGKLDAVLTEHFRE